MAESGGLENRFPATERGFKSYSLRYQYLSRRGGRVAEGSCLLSSCGGNSTPGSNPGLSALVLFLV